MNREQMIEKAARTSHQWGLDFGGEYAEWDALRESTRREYREEAAAVLDALLPQVTTVEELEALPNETALLYASDRGVTLLAWGPSVRGGGPTLWNGPHAIVASRIPDLLPLTVVWSPS